MALVIRKDNNKPGGGHAILEGPGLENASALVIKNGYSGLFLGADGRWSKTEFASPVEPHPDKADAVLLGPHIVDFIPTDFQVAFLKASGESLGEVFWTDIAPSRNAGSVTSSDVIGGSGGKPQQQPIGTGGGTGGVTTDPPIPDDRDDHKPPLRFIALGLAAALVVGSLVWALRPAPKPDDPSQRKQVVTLEKIVTPKPQPPAPTKPPEAVAPPREPSATVTPPKTETPTKIVTPPKMASLPTKPVAAPTPPAGPQCPSDPSEAYDAALGKISSDESRDQRDGERLLRCAQSGGLPEAGRKLGRLHVRMAKESGSPQARRDHAKMACDEGDQEGCRMWHATLDR